MAEHFNKVSHEYRLGRPDYPESLYDMIDSFTTGKELVWDVGTGNGQAAVMIARRFKRVVGTDSSQLQLDLAPKLPNILYAQTSMEPSNEELHSIVGPEGSVDLITVAQALHWFNLDLFYNQVKYFLRKPGGVLAAWCYPRKPFVNSTVDKVYDDFDLTTVPYWAPNVALIENGFSTLPFPFAAVDSAGEKGVGPFQMETVKQMTFKEYLLYLRSYSSVTNATSQGIHLLNEAVEKKLLDAWGSAETIRSVKFDVFLVIGKVPDSS